MALLVHLASLGLLDSRDQLVIPDLLASLDSLATLDSLDSWVPMVQMELLDLLEGLE